jgi:hypothetical protein
MHNTSTKRVAHVQPPLQTSSDLLTIQLALQPVCYCYHGPLQIPSTRPTYTPAGFVGAGVGVLGSDGATGGDTPGTAGVAGVAGVSGSCSC